MSWETSESFRLASLGPVKLTIAILITSYWYKVSVMADGRLVLATDFVSRLPTIAMSADPASGAHQVKVMKCTEHMDNEILTRPQDLDNLDQCGPAPGPRANETRRSLDDDIPGPRSLDDEDQQPGKRDHSLDKRYLVAEQIGEEYAPCRTCPTATRNSTCRIEKRYEFNDTVVSQCLTSEDIYYPNGTIQSTNWLVRITSKRHKRLYEWHC